MIISDLMTAPIAGVTPSDNLFQAVMLMQEKNCSCVLVSENGKPKGILTERDVVRIFSNSLREKSCSE